MNVKASSFLNVSAILNTLPTIKTDIGEVMEESQPPFALNTLPLPYSRQNISLPVPITTTTRAIDMLNTPPLSRTYTDSQSSKRLQHNVNPRNKTNASLSLASTKHARARRVAGGGINATAFLNQPPASTIEILLRGLDSATLEEAELHVFEIVQAIYDWTQTVHDPDGSLKARLQLNAEFGVDRFLFKLLSENLLPRAINSVKHHRKLEWATSDLVNIKDLVMALDHDTMREPYTDSTSPFQGGVNNLRMAIEAFVSHHRAQHSDRSRT